MATETERQRLRLDLGLAATDTTSLSDAAADALYAQAGETYSDAASIYAYARVIHVERLLIQASVEVDYTQNNSSEKSSQRFDHLNAILLRWQKRLDDAIVLGQGSAARFGRTTRKPARVREYPNEDGSWPWGF